MSEKRMVINKAHDMYHALYAQESKMLVSAILSHEEVFCVKLDLPPRIREYVDNAQSYRTKWLDSPLYVEE